MVWFLISEYKYICYDKKKKITLEAQHQFLISEYKYICYDEENITLEAQHQKIQRKIDN